MKDNLVLDIGCGTNNQYAAHPQGDVNCDIDTLAKHIKNFVRCDAHYLPFKNQVFHKVVAYHLIEHLSDLSKFIAEIERILKDHGEIEMVTPNIYSKTSWLDPSHIHHFNAESLSKIFQDFKTEIRGHEGLWIPLRGNVFLFKKLPFLKYFVFLSKNLKIMGVKKRSM